MRLADLEAIAGLEARIYAFPWSLGNFKDSVAAGYSCWVLEQASQIIGYCVLMVGVEEVHLLNISVSPTHQRQGLGSVLMRHLTDIAHGCNARRMLLEVRASNAHARQFYAAQGFRTLAPRPDYYPAEDGREDAIIMELPL